MPEISIIVPVYNGEKFIKRCYESIKNQTFKDFEVIFVDDGSKDNSLEILNNIKDEKVKVIHQKNKKQGGARNTGVKNASGKYISFVDIDDFISSDFLEGLYKVINEYNCDISMASVIRYKAKNKQKTLLRYDKKETVENKKEKTKVTIGNGTGRGVWNKLFKKDFLIKNNLWFRENVFYEDSDFCTKAVFYANRIATTNVGNYFYCVNPNSTMRITLDKKKQQDKYLGAKITLEFELLNELTDKVSDTINKYDFRFFGINFLRIKEKISLATIEEQWWLFDFINVYKKDVEKVANS